MPKYRVRVVTVQPIYADIIVEAEDKDEAEDMITSYPDEYLEQVRDWIPYGTEDDLSFDMEVESVEEA